MAVTLSACGQDEPVADAPARAEAKATATAGEKEKDKVSIRITEPAAGDEVGRRVTVAGRATPGTTVLLDGGCPACQAIARADDDGRWETELQLAPPKATIEASTASAPVRDTVAVDVRAPEVTPDPRPVRPRPQPSTPDPVTAPGAVVPLATLEPVAARVVVIGDSLAVGIKGLLGPLLPNEEVDFDARIGRPLAEGMELIGQADLTTVPTVLAVSLFTNDDPTEVDALEAAVRESAAAVGSGGCVVWATIVRPPVGGVTYDAANARLRALDSKLPNLRVVDWAGRVAAAPSLIASDGVHGTSLGYQARAALYAEAIRSC